MPRVITTFTVDCIPKPQPRAKAYRRGEHAGVYDPKTDVVTVTVHSLGSRPTPKTTVLISDGNGKSLLRATIPALEAPIDFKPRTTTVTVKGVKARGVRRVRACVDPEGKIPEITDENNAYAAAVR